MSGGCITRPLYHEIASPLHDGELVDGLSRVWIMREITRSGLLFPSSGRLRVAHPTIYVIIRGNNVPAVSNICHENSSAVHCDFYDAIWVIVDE